MAQHKICLIGGSGFVGHHLSHLLGRQGHSVRIPSRHPQRLRDLAIPPGVELVEADIHNPAALEQLLNSCDVVINLVGILNEKGDKGRGFHAAHVELTEKIIAACERSGIQRLLHMSALNAGKGESHYLKSKGEAESRLQAAVGRLDITIFRPSIIYGPGDSFFNRFAELLRLSPLLFPLACPDARFAPIYVGDVVHCFAAAIDNPATYDQAYALCGPKSYTFRELVTYTADLINTPRILMELSDWASRLQANVMEFAPGKPFSRDNYRSLQTDSVCSGEFPDIFGIEPRALEALVPLYLGQGRLRSHYDRYRSAARRS